MRTLIQNGTLVDPANRIHSKLNLVLDGGAVAEITAQTPLCQRVIDAAGRIVCPGFVDIHMHEDPYDAQAGRLCPSIMACMLRMGVTTAIGGNCGINTVAPDKYLELMDRYGGPVNMGLLAGHTFFRRQAGHQDKYTAVTDEELATLERLIRQQVEAGCLGVSFGIRYVPGLDHREMAAAARCLKGTGKLISAHVRDDAGAVFAAVDEFVQVGAELDVPVQVSHVGSMGGFGQMARLLQQLDGYRGMGLPVTGDCYPYYAFSTRIGETTYDEGFLERYQTDYGAIELCEGKYKGQRCTEEIFRELRRSAPETITVCHVMRREDVDLALTHPAIFPASDGLMDQGQGHPRAAGTFPRYWKNYVTTGLVSQDEALARMTALPAQKLGLSPKKGTLGKGADADVVIFDPEKLADRATFDDPTAAPEGIDYVLIGGEVAMDHGELVNAALGRAVRR